MRVEEEGVVSNAPQRDAALIVQEANEDDLAEQERILAQIRLEKENKMKERN